MLLLSDSKHSIRFTTLDLTHTLSPAVPTWNGSCGFQARVIVDYPEACRVQALEMNAGTGTHLDAPSHFIEGAKSIADLPIEDFIAPLCVLNVSHKAHANYYISVQDLAEFENCHGKIPAHSWVLGCTGWDRYWNDPERYRNVDPQGNMHFPGFSKEAAAYLLDRQIKGLGIDTLSPDCLDLHFPVHYLILGAGKCIAENLTNCHRLPPKGAYGLFLPIKTEQGTEAVMRALALIPA